MEIKIPKALGNKLIIQVIGVNSEIVEGAKVVKSEGGILMPTEIVEKNNAMAKGKVLSIGDKVLEVNIGDVVMYEKGYSSFVYGEDEQGRAIQYECVKEDNCLCIV